MATAGPAAAAPRRSYNSGISNALEHVTPMPHMPLSALEITAYFPHHVRWPELMFRLVRAGWKYKDIAKAQLHARGNLNRAELKRRTDSLRHAAITAGKAKFGPDFDGPHHGRYKDDPELQPVQQAHFTRANGYIQGVLEHYDVSEAEPLPTDILGTGAVTLQQVANGVINHPRGSQQGLLTQVLLHAQTVGWVDGNGNVLEVKDINAIIAQQSFVLPPEARTDQWDQDGLLFVDQFQIQ